MVGFFDICLPLGFSSLVSSSTSMKPEYLIEYYKRKLTTLYLNNITDLLNVELKIHKLTYY